LNFKRINVDIGGLSRIQSEITSVKAKPRKIKWDGPEFDSHRHTRWFRGQFEANERQTARTEVKTLGKSSLYFVLLAKGRFSVGGPPTRFFAFGSMSTSIKLSV